MAGWSGLLLVYSLASCPQTSFLAESSICLPYGSICALEVCTCPHVSGFNMSIHFILFFCSEQLLRECPMCIRQSTFHLALNELVQRQEIFRCGFKHVRLAFSVCHVTADVPVSLLQVSFY